MKEDVDLQKNPSSNVFTWKAIRWARNQTEDLSHRSLLCYWLHHIHICRQMSEGGLTSKPFATCDKWYFYKIYIFVPWCKLRKKLDKLHIRHPFSNLLIDHWIIRDAKIIQRYCQVSNPPPGVDFTNIFMHRFCTCGAQKRKKTDNLTAFFTLLGSAHVKAVCRTWMKLTPVECMQWDEWHLNCLLFS